MADAQLLVERRQRLVEQQHRWFVDDGAGKRHALLLAAGHFMDAALGETAEAHHFEGLTGPRRNL